MGIEILDWQLLHLGEHIVTKASHGSLGDIDHHSGLGKGGYNSQHVKACHPCHRSSQRSEIGILLSDQGYDIVIDQRLQEQGSLQRSKDGDKDTDQYNDPSHRIFFEGVAKGS